MGILDFNNELPVQGSIKFDAKDFPQELLAKMMSAPGQVPILNIHLPKVYVDGGMTLESRSDGPMTVSFDFYSDIVLVEEA